jgi:septal ring factor EnvC (AmiA/AmiB activator)
MRKLGPLRQFEQLPLARTEYTQPWTTQEDAEAACREYITSARREIADPRPEAGRIREKVNKLASELAKARNAARALPESVLSMPDVDEKFIADLERVRKAIEKFSDKIPVKKTNQKRAEGERMLIAASKARHLIVTWTENHVLQESNRNLKHAQPTELYVEIAKLMYKIATGKRSDMEQACAAHIELIWESMTSTGEPEPPEWLRRSSSTTQK